MLEWLYNNRQLVLEVTIIVLLLYVAFFKSYFQEKGRNLATKEDVEEITKLVEKVKSRLQFSLQATLSLRAEEHQALIDYFSKYSAWLSAITDCSFAGIDSYDSPRLVEIRTQLDMRYQDVSFAAGKMRLFVADENIRSQSSQLGIKTLKFHAHAQNMTFEFAGILLEAKRKQLEITPDEQLERFRESLEKRSELYARFKAEQIKMYSDLFPAIESLERTISNHIKALANGLKEPQE